MHTNLFNMKFYAVWEPLYVNEDPQEMVEPKCFVLVLVKNGKSWKDNDKQRV